MTGPVRDERVRDRFRTALDLFDLALRMKRQSLRRRHPGAGRREIDNAVAKWLAYRSGAEYGDADGVPAAWPRRRTS